MSQKPEELSPMLCFAYWNLRPGEQEAVWSDDNDWIAQTKINGVRVVLHFIKGVGVFAHSRGGHSVVDRLLFGDFIPDFTATVDTEAIVNKPVDTRPYTGNGGITKSSLHSTTAVLRMEPGTSKLLQLDQDAPIMINVFDIVDWQGVDLKKKPLCERLSYLADFRKALPMEWGNWFQFPAVVFQSKKAFFVKIISEGGEGVVLKNLNATYEDSSSRRREGWIKVKRQVEFDAFVSGFERGKPTGEFRNKVGCLTFSVHTEKGPHVIAKVVNIPYALRKRISVYNAATDSVELSPNAYGRVATVSGLEIAQRSFRLSHPKIIRWRGELTSDQCHYPWSDIEIPIWGSSGTSPMRVVKIIEG